ncbi:MAG: thiamine pyrophosphate-binding protein [Solirubrobacteraceae bacterium]
MNIADAVADVAAEQGADRAFAFPGGGSNLEVIDALERRNVSVVLARSEGGAAMMGAAYADLVGRPVVVLVGLGPGTANVVNGAAHAFLDQSSLVVLADRPPVAERRRTGHQVLDQAAMLRPVTKLQAAVGPVAAGDAVRTAFTVAASPPRGPVYLELDAPTAVSSPVPSSTAGQPVENLHVNVPGRSGLPSHEQRLAAAVDALGVGSRLPVVLIGEEALRVDPDTLRMFVQRLGAPVLTSYKAKGVIDEDHPLWCGIVTNAALEASVLRAADMILAIGLDPVELLARPWPATAPVIAVREHAEPASGYSPAYVLEGDISELMRELAASVDTEGAWSSDWSASRIAELREGMLGAVRVPASPAMSALEVVEAVQAATPGSRTATVTVDAGAHMFAVTWGWRSSRPQRFLISNGLATMGFAVPAAVAAALARPQERVLAFTGDGGLLLHGTEIETAVRLGLRIVIVVFNDSGLSLIRIKQESRGYARAAVDFGLVDAAGFARSLGAIGLCVETHEELGEAIADAHRRQGPVIVDVRIAGDEYGQLEQVIRSTGADHLVCHR